MKRDFQATYHKDGSVSLRMRRSSTARMILSNLLLRFSNKKREAREKGDQGELNYATEMYKHFDKAYAKIVAGDAKRGL